MTPGLRIVPPAMQNRERPTTTCARPGGPGQHQRAEARQEKIARCPILFGTTGAVPRGGKFSTCPGVEEGGADRPQWFAGCGMLVAGGFCYRSLVDESRIARESQNSPDSCACLRPAPQHLEWLRAEQTAAFCAASNPASPGRRAAAFTPRSGFLRYATPRPRDSPIPEGRSRPPRRWRSMAVVPCRA